MLSSIKRRGKGRHILGNVASLLLKQSALNLIKVFLLLTVIVGPPAYSVGRLFDVMSLYKCGIAQKVFSIAAISLLVRAL